MNILKITNHLRECSLYETETGSIPVDLKSLGHLAEALEQHHKDLMGLVADWRTWAELNTPKWDSHDEYSLGISRASDWCADELESLINPKD